MFENSLLTDVNSLLQKFLTWKLVFEMHQNLVTTCSIIVATNCQCLRNINRMNRTSTSSYLLLWTWIWVKGIVSSSSIHILVHFIHAFLFAKYLHVEICKEDPEFKAYFIAILLRHGNPTSTESMYLSWNLRTKRLGKMHVQAKNTVLSVNLV